MYAAARVRWKALWIPLRRNVGCPDADTLHTKVPCLRTSVTVVVSVWCQRCGDGCAGAEPDPARGRTLPTWILRHDLAARGFQAYYRTQVRMRRGSRSSDSG